MAAPVYASVLLQGRQIRLVTVKAADTHSKLLRCSLTVKSLDDSVKFDALSYCWGSPTATATILVNDEEFVVTENLAGALRHFQLTGDGSTTPLWIDAICINQQDLEERKSQVSMMGEIYKAAETVHIWLGGPELVPRDGMQALRELAQFNAQYSSNSPAPWPSIGDSSSAAKVEALVSIAHNPYWRRTWILQEVSFARNIIVHGHDDRIVLETGDGIRLPFVDMRDRLMISQESNAKVREVAEIFEPMTMAAWSAGVAQAIADGDPAFSRIPQVLFTRFRHSLATDPRDKIFGMLSLLPNVFENLPPDYSKTMKEVYRDATLGLVRRSKDLEILCQACSGCEDLPSWVPDFRVPSRIPKYMTDYWITCRAGFAASMETELTSAGFLRTRGFYVDEIAHIERGGGFDPQVGFFEIRKPILRWFSLFHQHAAPSMPRNQGYANREHIFWRAICGGGADGQAFDAEHKIACQQMMGYSGTAVPEIEIEDFYDRDFIGYLSRVVQDHDFFVTSQGHAGLVLKESVEVGDSIFILAGANVPFCARRVQATGKSIYTLRGPCFVENHVITKAELDDDVENKRGIMDGGVVLSRANELGVGVEFVLGNVFLA